MTRRWQRRRGIGSLVRKRRGAGVIIAGSPLSPGLGLLPERQNLVSWVKTLVPTTPDPEGHEAVIRQMLDSWPTTALPGLDYDMRWRTSWRTDTWESLTVNGAGRLLAAANDTVTVAAGLSMHRSGHIRQLAVTALEGASTPRAIRWLVLRCGDWVPQVRDAARSGIDWWLVPNQAVELIDSLPLLDGDRFSAGRPYSDLRIQIVSVLSNPASHHAVEQGVLSRSRPVRRACVGLLIDSGADISLLERTMATNDIVAIAMVAAAIPTTGPVNREAGKAMLGSPMARFRSEGLWRLIKDDEPGSEVLALDALSDAAPSVREVAQRWLSEQGHDPADNYRSMLNTNPLPALRGLGDRPNMDDTDLARMFVDDGLGPIRAAALRLLAGLGNRTDGPLFASRFLTGTAKERRHALAGLRRIGAARFIDDMWAQAETNSDPRLAERVIYQVLPLAGRWKRLDIGLQAASSNDPTVRSVGLEALQRTLVAWNRGYPSRPTDPDLLQKRLHDARPALANVRHRNAHPSMLDSLENLLRPPPDQRF